jgi:hypothetical protein
LSLLHGRDDVVPTNAPMRYQGRTVVPRGPLHEGTAVDFHKPIRRSTIFGLSDAHWKSRGISRYRAISMVG